MTGRREIRIEHFAPSKPDAHLIRLIHRDHPDSVALAQLDRGQWVQGANVPAAELDLWFPRIDEHLERDAFFSIHGFYGIAKSKSPWCAELGGGLRTRARLQWLTSCFVDLDLHRDRIDVEHAIACVRDLETDGTLPRASILARSGRGIWLLWLLRDREGSRPLRARDRVVDRFNRIQNAIAARVPDLCPDASARDASRVMRIPGSVNSKSGSVVCYDVSFDSRSSELVAYTLDDLAHHFGVESPSPRKSTSARDTADPSATAVGRLGPWRKAFWNLLRFGQLLHLRADHGFPIGTRHSAGWLLVLWLRVLNVRRAAAVELVQAFFEGHCAHVDAKGRVDRLGHNEAVQTVRAVYDAPRSELRIRSQMIANKLDLTPAEAGAIDAVGDVPWPAAERFGDVSSGPQSARGRTTHRRRNAISNLLDDSIERASLSELRSFLAKLGLDASRETLRNDLHALGLAEGRRRRSRRSTSSD